MFMPLSSCLVHSEQRLAFFDSDLTKSHAMRKTEKKEEEEEL